jgi:hypothetical protein
MRPGGDATPAPESLGGSGRWARPPRRLNLLRFPVSGIHLLRMFEFARLLIRLGQVASRLRLDHPSGFAVRAAKRRR